MNENVVVAVFDVESEAFQAIYDFKRDFSNNDYVISHIALVKKRIMQLKRMIILIPVWKPQTIP